MKAGDTGHATARMRTGTAEKESPDRRGAARCIRVWPHRKQLVQLILAMSDVTAGQSVLAFQVERRQSLLRND